MENPKIYEKGLEEYPKSSAVVGNSLMVLWIALGTAACWFVHSWIAWMYLALALLMIGLVLRKLLCTNCYYYDKWCHIGWGKLAALFFKKSSMEKFNTSIGQKLAPATYGLLSLIPIVLVAYSLFKEFEVLKVIVLALILGISIYSGMISRKKTCAQCKMRLMCKGCAAK